jgi:hypothetical protein
VRRANVETGKKRNAASYQYKICVCIANQPLIAVGELDVSAKPKARKKSK